MKCFRFFIFFLCQFPVVFSADTLILENSGLQRKILIDREKGLVSTFSFIHRSSGYDFHRDPSCEFSFLFKGKEITGTSGDFEIKSISERDGNTRIILTGIPGGVAGKLEVYLNYSLSGSDPGMKKDLMIRNTGNEEVLIKSIAMEDLNVDPWGGANSVIYANFGRDFYKPPYKGYHEDPAVFIKGSKGTLIAGNEAPGLTRYTEIFAGGPNRIRIGMRPDGDPYAVNIRIKPGEVFESPRSFLLFCPVEGDPSGMLREFVLKTMDLPMFEREDFPSYFYNTWVPFGTGINEVMIREIADSLEGAGAGFLIIDDGWQDYYGDWNPHPEKFPSGMKALSDYIRMRGMKPGIWFSLCSVEYGSKAFEQFRNYCIRNTAGEPRNLHGWANDLRFYSMDILSPWYDEILNKTRILIEEYGFEYLKIDLSFVKSAYITNPDLAGTYKKGDPQSNHEFFYPAYLKLLQYFDELRVRYPQVIIDCTYELWGDHHAVDYALIQHAHVDWIANLADFPPEGSRDIRSLAWRQGNILPTATMMIGNQQMHVPGHQFSFISGFAGIPMMLGDPRLLSREEKGWYRQMAAWFSAMQEKYHFMPYYSTQGFDKPETFNWDGFVRYNPGTRGGIFCVFRNKSPDSVRSIPLVGLLPGTYRIKDEHGVSVGIFTSGELVEAGVPVSIESPDSARVFEIESMGSAE